MKLNEGMNKQNVTITSAW